MHIQDQEIRRIVNDEKEYRYGRFYNIHDILERMTISLDEDNNYYRVNARIHDGIHKPVISMKISQDGHIMQSSCSCDYGIGCRHTAAILFFLRKLTVREYPYFYDKEKETDKVGHFQKTDELIKKRIIDKKQKESLDLIELYKDQLLRESLIPLSTEQYQIKVFVEKKKDILEISLKIQNDKQSYVVKNIEHFLNAITHHESLKYGKNFEFIHTEDAFDDDSLDIISFIRKCFLKNQFMQKGIIKTLVVSEEQIDEFYELMSLIPSFYCDIGFDKKDYIIPLEMSEKDDQYVLDFIDYQDLNYTIMTSQYIYTLENDILYRFDFIEPKKCLILIQKLLESQGGLYIPKDSIMDFYKYILVDILDNTNITTHLFDDYYQENIINLYADMTSSDTICIQLEYIYDEEIRYGFDDDNYHQSKEADLIESYLKPYIDDIDDHIIYLINNHDFVYEFVKDGLPYLSSYCQIYISDALKDMSLNQSMNIRLGVSVSEGLLNINIESIDVNQQELYDILKAYKKQRKFYKLKDGRIVSLENKELKEFDELTSALQLKPQDLAEGYVNIPSYRLFELENIMDQESEIQYMRSQEFEKWSHEMTSVESDYAVPVAYQDILRDYQIDGYQWLHYMHHYGFGGILADDMGLGKTLQMIVYFESIKNQGVHIVVTPASLLLNWQSEIEKFSSSLNVLCIYGSREYREELIHHIHQYDVILTSYDYLRRDVSLYDEIEFQTIVLDEAQNIKNPKTRNAVSVKKLKGRQKFALTGTPIENSLAELWSIFDFLMPHYLYHYSYFLENFERPIVKEHNEEKQSKLKQMISPFVLRRNKRDVLKELPDKIEQTIYYRFNEEEEKLYLATLVQVNRSLQEKLDMQQLGRIDVLAMLTRLRQLCQDPRLLYEDRNESSSKLEGCMELIHSLKDNNKKILLFSSFTSVLDLIASQCQKEHISYYMLTGKTSKEKRKQLVDSFQQDETTLFLISLKAGGSGLNLTNAQAVIHFDPWWNMSAKNQATDRAHRIGQTETVQVFSLIMKNSIEEKIQELQKKKMNLADAFVEGNEGNISSMSIEDMKSLFEI